MKSLSMKTKLTTALLAFLFITSLYSQNSVLDIPSPKTFVNDYANLLDDDEEKRLEQKIREHEGQTSNQIALVTVNSLEGYSPNDLARQLANKWGVGQKGKNNGVLILVKPKYPNERGQVYITVGYGLEHALTDAAAKRIIDKVIIPHFKSENYYKGLDKALDRITARIDGSSSVIFNKDLLSVFKVLMLLLTFITLCLPFIYLSYLKRRKVDEKYAKHFITGDYNSANVIKQVELIEKENNKKFRKFKKQILNYERVSKNKLLKYADNIDRILFCHLLNGRSRAKVFQEMCDPFLKFIVVYLFIFFTALVAFVYMGYGQFPAFMTAGVSLLAIYCMLNMLVSLVEMQLYSLRKNAKYLGGISVSLFALNALFKRNIEKRFDHKTNSFVYHPVIIISSGGYGGGGYSGGGFGGGGFGGGGFGGGGAGGSW